MAEHQINFNYDAVGDNFSDFVRRCIFDSVILQIAKLFAEYTIEKDGQEITHIKKGLFRSLSGNVYDKSLEIRVAYESYNFDILVGGHKLCRIEQENASFRDSYEMMIFDSTLEEVAVALAVICDHVSDKDSTWRH